MSSTHQQIFPPGTQVAQYEVECVLGQGAMGVVYLALQGSLDRMVALKILKPNLAQDKEFVHRFFNEARAAAALSHPHIVQVYDAGTAGENIYYFVMEYVRGETLHDRVRREGPLDWQKALAICHDLADALGYGWRRQKLVHGDIKPENVMVSQVGDIKLADFGLAKVTEHDSGEGLMLTPLYAAPELIGGTVVKADCRSDIYSFGATLYHLLSGEPPFPGHDPQAVMSRHLTEAVPPLSGRGLDVSPELCHFVCNELLCKDPNGRPQDWDAVLKALDELRTRRARKMVVTVPVAGGQQNRGARSIHVAAQGQVEVNGPAPKHADDSLGPLFKIIAVLLFAGMLIGGGAYWIMHRNAIAAASRKPVPSNATQQPTDSSRVSLVEKSVEPLPQPQPQPPPPPRPQPQPHPKPIETPVPTPTPAEVRPPQPVGPTPEELACRRADDTVELIADGTTQMSQIFNGNMEPFMRRCKDWLGAHPESSPETDLVRKFVEWVVPAREEFFPKLLVYQAELVGMQIPLKSGSALSLRKFSATELTLTQRTQYGEMAVRHPWTAVNAQTLLTKFGLKVLAKSNQSPRERAPLLAFLLTSGQHSMAATQIAALPNGPDKDAWLQLYNTFRTLPVEGTAIRLWREAETAMKEQRSGAAYQAVQKLKLSQSQVTARHATDIETISRQCASMVPVVQASALVQQAQEAMTTKPGTSLNLLNCALARFGNVEFPEKDDIARLREKAISLLADEGIPGMNRVAWHQFQPCIEPARQAYPGVSAVIYALIKDSDEATPQVKKRLSELYPLVLLEMGDWAGAKPILTLTIDEETRIPLRLKGSILFGQLLAAQRFGSETITIQSQIRKLREVLEEVNSAPMPEQRPNDRRTEEEFRRHVENSRQSHQLILCRLMLDGIFWCRSWTTSASWPSTDELLRLGPSAGPLLMAILAYDLESNRRAEGEELLKCLADGDTASGVDPRFVREIAAYIKAGEKDDKAPSPDTDASPDATECNGRLLVSAFLIRLPSLAPENAATDGKTIAEAVRPNGWLGATAWFDLLLGRLSVELGQKDYRAAEALLQKAVDEESAYTSAFYPQLRFLQAGVAAASGSPGRARDLLEMVAASQTANIGERAAASLAGTDEDCAFWRAWLGWANAVKGKNAAEAKRMAGLMSSSAANLAMKRLAQSAQRGASSSGTN